MAENKEAKAKAEAEAKAKAEAEAKAKAEAEAYEEIFVPKTSKNDDSLFVAVNGKRILIRKGELVKVPKAHAAVIKNSFKQTAKNEEFIAANSKE